MVLFIKTYVHLWYVVELFLEWEVFQRKVVEKSKTYILFSITFSKNGATYDNIIWQICFAWWITKAPNTHAEYILITDFPRQQLLRKCTSILRLNVCGLSWYLLPVNSVNWLYHSAFYGMLRERESLNSLIQRVIFLGKGRDFAASDNI